LLIDSDLFFLGIKKAPHKCGAFYYIAANK